MLRARERWVIHSRIKLDPVPHDGPLDMRLRDVLQRLEGLMTANRAVHRVDGDQQSVRISDLRWYPNAEDPAIACMLLTYGDVRGSDPSFNNMDTGTVRTVRKGRNEANAVSAHLIMKLRARIVNGRRHYAALLEDIPGIGKTKIQPAITALLKNCPAFRYTDAENQAADARPKFILDPAESEDLASEVTRGTLKYFVLVRDIPTTELDEETTIEEVQETLKIKPADPEVTGRLNITNLFGKVAALARRKRYNEVKVVYNRRDGRNRTISLDTPREDAEDFLIKKIDKIELNQSLEHARERISDELFNKMRAILTPNARDEEDL
jgi:hypothetical protein